MTFEPFRYSAHNVLLPGNRAANEAVFKPSRAPRADKNSASSLAFGPPFNFLGRPGPPMPCPPVPMVFRRRPALSDARTRRHLPC